METKYCPMCEEEKPIEKFGLEGKGRFDKNGQPARRRICNECKWLKAKSNKGQNKDTKYCPLCDTDKPIKEFSKTGKKTAEGEYKRKKHCNSCRKLIKQGKISKADILKSEQREIEKQIEKEELAQKQEKIEEKKELLVHALIELARTDLSRLENISKDEFVHKTNSISVMKEIGETFTSLKEEAKKKIHKLGFHHPKGENLGAGRYLIVSDSHGKHTKKKMFELLKNLNKNLDIKNVIHVGHILDDDSVISYVWKDFDNVIVVSKIEESPTIEQHLVNGYNFDVMRDCCNLGNLKVMNQDLISDYVKTPVGNLDQMICPGSVMVNSHRHEMDSRCTYDGTKIIASPGCLCEKHIVKVIKQIDFQDGYQVKEAKATSFIKYRRMIHMYEFWEQGVMIVDVNDDGTFFLTPCSIKKVGEEYATSVFDKIYIGSEVVEPDEKIFINADLHCSKHDYKVLDVQDKIVKDYKPTKYVNLGDMQNNDALNHHKMDRGGVCSGDLVEENAATAYILKRLSSWADKKYFLFGNHERFARDFSEKYPQLLVLLDEMLKSIVKENGFDFIEHQQVLEFIDVKLVHGDIKMFGQKGGSCIEKIARTFGRNSIIGHQHFNGIRFGCYIIGLTGKMDMGYNEAVASRWVHGFGLCNTYKGVSWISNHNIIDYKIMLNNKVYASNNEDMWQTPEFDFSINYKFKEK